MEDTDKSRGRILFSYSRRDEVFALQLANDLRQGGVQVWIDQQDIPKGSRWDNELEAALRATKTTLVILSPDSVSSENVRDEISAALRDGDHIIPVLYRKCDVPLRLSRVQYFDFTGDYASALAGLQAHCATRGAEAPVAPLSAAHNPANSLEPVARSAPPAARRFGVIHGLAAGGALTFVALVTLALMFDDSAKKQRVLLDAELAAVKNSGLVLGAVTCSRELGVEPGESFNCDSSVDGVALRMTFTARSRLEDDSVDHFDLTLDGAVDTDAVQREAQKRFGSSYRVSCPQQRWAAKPEASQDCTLSLGSQSEALRVRTTDSHGGFDLALDQSMTIAELKSELGGDYAQIENLSCGNLRVLLKQPSAGPQVCELRFANGDKVNMNVYFESPGAEVDYEPSSDRDDAIASPHELRTARR